MPRGVVNIVTGDGATGELIVRHEGVDKIAFTGSTEVGRKIREATAGSGKALTLELGGKSPFIVFDDADLDSAVEGVVDAIWFNQGQVCCAGSRLLVQESIHDALHRQAQGAARHAPRRPAARQGDRRRRDRRAGAARAHQGAGGAGRRRGRRRSSRRSATLPGKGLYFPPTLLTNVQPASTCARVEIFGPVLVAMTFRTPDEAVALANNTEYGLAASVWSESINLALDIAPKLKAGVVWVNSTNLFDASSGFGGYKESGYGREGGREGVSAYTKPAWLAEGEAARRAEAGDAEAELGPDARRRLHRPHGKALYRRQAAAAGRRLFAPGRRRRTASSSARSARATARTSGTPSRRRGRRQAGPRRASTTARRSSTTSPRISPSAPTSSPPGSRPLTGARRRRGQGRGRRRRSPASSPSPPGPTSTRAPSTSRRSAASRSP